jgi:hypothetical protein
MSSNVKKQKHCLLFGGKTEIKEEIEFCQLQALPYISQGTMTGSETTLSRVTLRVKAISIKTLSKTTLSIR